MNDEIIIWHNPRCSKSRAALKLLEERGITPKVRRYLDEPPSEAEIRDVRPREDAVLAALGTGAGSAAPDAPLDDGDDPFEEPR